MLQATSTSLLLCSLRNLEDPSALQKFGKIEKEKKRKEKKRKNPATEKKEKERKPALHLVPSINTEHISHENSNYILQCL